MRTRCFPLHVALNVPCGNTKFGSTRSGLAEPVTLSTIHVHNLVLMTYTILLICQSVVKHRDTKKVDCQYYYEQSGPVEISITDGLTLQISLMLRSGLICDGHFLCSCNGCCIHIYMYIFIYLIVHMCMSKCIYT